MNCIRFIGSIQSVDRSTIALLLVSEQSVEHDGVTRATSLRTVSRVAHSWPTPRPPLFFICYSRIR